MKFYTEEGNWDLVGNNTPVFFLRDPLKFPDLNHAIKRDPKTNMRSPNSNWDFWTLLPEALHQVTITMSPRGIPYSYRHMHGFGSHTYSFINAENQRIWVKFHLRTLQGIKNLTDQEAEAIVAKDRESHQRDLFESIEKGDYPKWLFQIQLMTEEEADNYRINPFDLTKVWPHKDFPLQDVGVLELNRNPENYFAEVEQAAFNPMNIVDGIGLSPDKMLQGRLFSYDQHLNSEPDPPGDEDGAGGAGHVRGRGGAHPAAPGGAALRGICDELDRRAGARGGVQPVAEGDAVYQAVRV